VEIAVISLLGVLLISTVSWGYNIGKKIGKFNGKVDIVCERLEALEKRFNEVEHQIEHLITGKSGNLGGGR